LSLHDYPKKTNAGEPTVSALLTSMVDSRGATFKPELCALQKLRRLSNDVFNNCRR